jgi:hypothetical protein
VAQGTDKVHAASMAASDDDLQLGDLVVIMAEPGPFRVAEIDPPYVVIESNQGVRRRVRDVAVRKVSADPPVAR